MKQLCIALLAALSTAACAQPANNPDSAPPTPPRTIESLDVPRYMGTWYEIAKYPNRFQNQCVSDTQARYQLRADASVQVLNQCKNTQGKVEEAMGQARQVGDATSPKLRVRFAPAWLSWLPFVWGNYWVIDLDESYQLAAVSEPSREYLWILSRQPQVQPEAYNALLARLKAQGFDLTRLQVTPHQR